MLATYMLHPVAEPSQALARFIERVAAIEASEGDKCTESNQPDPAKEPES